MAITAGQTARADDFINSSENAGTSADNGKVPKLEQVGSDHGRLAKEFLPSDTLFAATKKISIDTTEVAMSNGQSGTETTLYSGTIPGGSLGTNNGVRFKIFFSQLNINSGTTLTLRVKLGSTTIATFSLTASNPNIKAILEGLILADGATNAQKILAELRAYNGGFEIASDASIGFTKTMHLATGSATEDSTSNKTLAITAQYSVSGAANDDLQSEATIVELVAA